MTRTGEGENESKGFRWRLPPAVACSVPIRGTEYISRCGPCGSQRQTAQSSRESSVLQKQIGFLHGFPWLTWVICWIRLGTLSRSSIVDWVRPDPEFQARNQDRKHFHGCIGSQLLYCLHTAWLNKPVASKAGWLSSSMFYARFLESRTLVSAARRRKF